MFDFMPHGDREMMTAAPALFLSNPFGTAREWDGIAGCLGPRAASKSFENRVEWSRAVAIAPDGAHLIAHGSASYDALSAALHAPDGVRSVTLVDPDIIAALPELSACLQFRRHGEMIQRAATLAERQSGDRAAEFAIDWWMGKGAWSRTSDRLRARFAAASELLVADWRRQSASPFDLIDLTRMSVPVRIVTGRKAPAEICAMARLLRIVIPGLSAQVVKAAGAASHLTDPHIVGPDVSNFIVLSDRDWQTRPRLATAA